MVGAEMFMHGSICTEWGRENEHKGLFFADNVSLLHFHLKKIIKKIVGGMFYRKIDILFV